MRPLARPVLFAAAWLVVAGAAAGVSATPHKAHLHYMVGVRAYAGTRHAAMLHHEASAEGVDLQLAGENALDMQKLATEIGAWLGRIEKEQSAADKAKIEAQLASMKAAATALREQSAALSQAIDAAMSTWKGPATPGVREDIVERCRGLFAGFQSLLKQHKDAEAVLGIPVPPDPPAPPTEEPVKKE